MARTFAASGAGNVDAQLALARMGLTLGNGKESAQLAEIAQVARAEYSPPLIEAMSAYLASVENSNKSKQTLKAYRSALRLFGEWLFGHYPQAVCADLSHPMIDE